MYFFPHHVRWFAAISTGLMTLSAPIMTRTTVAFTIHIFSSSSFSPWYFSSFFFFFFLMLVDAQMFLYASHLFVAFHVCCAFLHLRSLWCVGLSQGHLCTATNWDLVWWTGSIDIGAQFFSLGLPWLVPPCCPSVQPFPATGRVIRDHLWYSLILGLPLSALCTASGCWTWGETLCVLWGASLSWYRWLKPPPFARLHQQLALQWVVLHSPGPSHH